ncbi:hypothetical protein [Streptosporangium sandarakinum]|uniref:Uncharacterized protein n=1 Tax=Streptosporangium sandarakinum TaxID=1260955 RepID=A0A852V6I5_9ACTN|nr:hypothetical protein [Streptosporangium sandarakinum]NYF43756.1 hypothetical protein [Streptosporangium sandarakinum]
MSGATYKFLLAGWEKRSVWGFDVDESGGKSYWADLYRNENSDDEPDGKFRGGEPPMWSLDYGALYNEILNYIHVDPDQLQQAFDDGMDEGMG